MPNKKTIPPPIFTLRGHHADVTALHLIDNLHEPFLVSGDLNGVVIIWNMLTLRIATQSNELTTGKILSIKQIFQNKSTTSSCLVIQSREGFVKLVRVEEKKVSPDELAAIIIEEIKSYPSSPLLFSRGDSITIEEKSYLAHSSIIEECQIALRVIDCNFKTVNSAPIKRPAIAGAKSVPSCFDVKLIASSEKNLYILCGYEDGVVCVFYCVNKVYRDKSLNEKSKMESGLEISLIRNIDTEFKEFITSFDYCIHSDLLICGSPLDKILIAEINLNRTVTPDQPEIEGNEKITARFEYLDLKSNGVSQISIRPDAKLFAAALWNSQIRIYSTSKKLKLLAIIDNHSKRVDGVIFVEDKWSLSAKHETSSLSNNTNYLMICASGDKTISLWSLFNDT